MISLVVPTLNEAENIAPLLARIRRCEPAPDQIIFVDDGSTDGTCECIRSFASSAPVQLIERDAPALGLAGAVIAGARAAEGDWLVVMDADLSHPPEKIAELLRPLLEGKADMVIGSRYVEGGSTPGWPIWRKILSPPRCRPRLSAHRRARFDVRVFRDAEKAPAGIRSVRHRLQNCL